MLGQDILIGRNTVLWILLASSILLTANKCEEDLLPKNNYDAVLLNQSGVTVVVNTAEPRAGLTSTTIENDSSVDLGILRYNRDVEPVTAYFEAVFDFGASVSMMSTNDTIVYEYNQFEIDTTPRSFFNPNAWSVDSLGSLYNVMQSDLIYTILKEDFE